MAFRVERRPRYATKTLIVGYNFVSKIYKTDLLFINISVSLFWVKTHLPYKK